MNKNPPDLSILGFQPSEVQIYWTLLNSIYMEASQIMEKLNLSKPTVYNAIKKLMDLNLLKGHGKNPTKYSATSPKKLNELKNHTMRSYEQILNKAISDANNRFEINRILTCKHKQTKKPIMAEMIYSQPKDAMIRLKEGLTNATKKISVSGVNLTFFEKLLPTFRLLDYRGISIVLQFQMDEVIPATFKRFLHLKTERISSPQLYIRLNNEIYPLIEFFIDQTNIISITLGNREILFLSVLSSPRCISCIQEFREKIILPQQNQRIQLPLVDPKDLILQILQKKPLTRTELSYQAGLSGRKVKELLDELISSEKVLCLDPAKKGSLFSIKSNL